MIEVKSARRLYGKKAAVDGASLTVEAGLLTCLLGPSGCGKSTLLRLIAGLEPSDGGEISAGGRLLSGAHVHIAPEERQIGFVFQDYALFPHLTVEQNVAFGLTHLPRDQRRARALAELSRVRLSDRAGAWPNALSGGEQQRVALARALARDPAAILLDEPFSGLDGRLKAEVRDAALEALREAGTATLIVTHDAEEALMMADHLALMSGGRILQSGAPRDCYLNPVSMAAARLLGEANELPVTRLDAGRVHTAFGYLEGAGAVVMARPEGLILGEGPRAKVTAARFAGGFVMLTLYADQETGLARVPVAGAPKVGDEVHVRLDPAFCTVFAE
ncbi:MAG TPA: ABC transporter ATP-binding protein [Caulobacteraceae bacterium]|nr:ABC transporter ATP-binding protein [Caulobacteraceae bacterium]